MVNVRAAFHINTCLVLLILYSCVFAALVRACADGAANHLHTMTAGDSDR